MATFIFNHEKTFFLQTFTLTHVIKLNDIEDEGFARNTFKHFIISLGRISHTWPHNPHDCGQS